MDPPYLNDSKSFVPPNLDHWHPPGTPYFNNDPNNDPQPLLGQLTPVSLANWLRPRSRQMEPVFSQCLHRLTDVLWILRSSLCQQLHHPVCCHRIKNCGCCDVRYCHLLTPDHDLLLLFCHPSLLSCLDATNRAASTTIESLIHCVFKDRMSVLERTCPFVCKFYKFYSSSQISTAISLSASFPVHVTQNCLFTRNYGHFCVKFVHPLCTAIYAISNNIREASVAQYADIRANN